jgi:hypothetical protein
MATQLSSHIDRSTESQPLTIWIGRAVILYGLVVLGLVLTQHWDLWALATDDAWTPFASSFNGELVAVAVIVAVPYAPILLAVYRFAYRHVQIRGRDAVVPFVYLLLPVITLAVAATYAGLDGQSLGLDPDSADEIVRYCVFCWVSGLPAVAFIIPTFRLWDTSRRLPLSRLAAVGCALLLIVAGGPALAGAVATTPLDPDSDPDVTASDADLEYEQGAFKPEQGALHCANTSTAAVWADESPENTFVTGYAPAEVHTPEESGVDVFVAPRYEQVSGEPATERRVGWTAELRIDGSVPKTPAVIETTALARDDGTDARYSVLSRSGRIKFGLHVDRTIWMVWDIVNSDGEVHRYVTALCGTDNESTAT